MGSGKASIFIWRVYDLVPDWQAEVECRFGIPSGTQVSSILNSDVTPSNEPLRVMNLPSLRICKINYILHLVFGWLPAELGPETCSNRSGSKTGAESTQIGPADEILKLLRDHFLVPAHN